MSPANAQIQLPELSEILLLGFYPAEEFTHFIEEAHFKYGVPIEYLEERESSDTAGGLLQFQERILRSVDSKKTEAVLVLNADICGDLPVREVFQELREKLQAEALILSTEATREQASNFGCLVVEPAGGQVLHYVEKPSTFVSLRISCGLYALRPDFWPNQLQPAAAASGLSGQLWFETDVFPQMAAGGKLFALHPSRWWSQTKTPA